MKVLLDTNIVIHREAATVINEDIGILFRWLDNLHHTKCIHPQRHNGGSVMQMGVLLSIKPEFALKIFDGSKRYEYRRSIFKRGEITRIVVYASDPIQKVIGEFEIGEILHDEPQSLWAKTGEHAGISQQRFLEYFRNKAKGYAIQIKSTEKYNVPLPLNSFTISPPPPQSFMYL